MADVLNEKDIWIQERHRNRYVISCPFQLSRIQIGLYEISHNLATRKKLQKSHGSEKPASETAKWHNRQTNMTIIIGDGKQTSGILGLIQSNCLGIPVNTENSLQLCKLIIMLMGIIIPSWRRKFFHYWNGIILDEIAV